MIQLFGHLLCNLSVDWSALDNPVGYLLGLLGNSFRQPGASLVPPRGVCRAPTGVVWKLQVPVALRLSRI